MKKTCLFLLCSACVICCHAQNGITLSDDENYNANNASVLDVYSTSKGVLVPRLTGTQMSTIESPPSGLLVYNIDMNAFYHFNGNSWTRIINETGNEWITNPGTGDIFLSNTNAHVGIGTDSPIGKLSVKGNTGSDPDSPLFEVKDEYGIPIFTVTSEGVRIYIKDSAKGVSGGFAVGRYGIAKTIPDTTFFLVTPDSTRVWLQEGEKGASGGFAVGRYGIAKGDSKTLFYTAPDSARIYTETDSKGVSGGFAVGRYGIAKGSDHYLHLTQDNYLIGHQAGKDLTNGIFNLFLGFEAGMHTTGGVNNYGSYNLFAGHEAGWTNRTGFENIFIGYRSGYLNTSGGQNIFIGKEAGQSNNNGYENLFIGLQAGNSNQSGHNNLFIGEMAGYSCISGYTNVAIGKEAGYSNDNIQNMFLGISSGKMNTSGIQNLMIGLMSGYNNDDGSGNVFIGTASGYNNKGSGNIFIGKSSGYNESGDNKLYIENSLSSSPLIYGDFGLNYVQFNVNTESIEGKVNINNVLKLTPRNSAPTAPEKGDLYYDGTLNVIRVYDGTIWHNLW